MGKSKKRTYDQIAESQESDHISGIDENGKMKPIICPKYQKRMKIEAEEKQEESPVVYKPDPIPAPEENKKNAHEEETDAETKALIHQIQQEEQTDSATLELIQQL